MQHFAYSITKREAEKFALAEGVFACGPSKGSVYGYSRGIIFDLVVNALP